MRQRALRDGPIPLFIVLHAPRRLASPRLFQTVNPPPPLARTFSAARGCTSSTKPHAAVANAATGSAITLSAPPSIFLRNAPQSGRWRSAK